MVLNTVGGNGKQRVGLVVAFAALGETEQRAVQVAWKCAAGIATHWEPALAAYGLRPVSKQACSADMLVYLGESSRFASVAGEASCGVPILFVKSTVEELLAPPPDAAPRYRMCTGVKGIAWALAHAASVKATVDWQTLPWPEAVAGLIRLDEAEGRYVDISVEAFREAAERRGIRWREGLPGGGCDFSVFLTMHDPAAAILAQTALDLWPQCTVLTADGMVSTQSPDGREWPNRLVRVRHWSRRSRSASNRLFRQEMRGEPLPDFDSAGMLFGTMRFLDSSFAEGALPTHLHLVGTQPGPLGSMRMTASGRPEPERLVVFRGDHMRVVKIDL